MRVANLFSGTSLHWCAAAGCSDNAVGDLDALSLEEVRRQSMKAGHDRLAIFRHDHGVDLDVLAGELRGSGILLVNGSVPLLGIRNRGLEAIDGSRLSAAEYIIRVNLQIVRSELTRMWSQRREELRA